MDVRTHQRGQLRRTAAMRNMQTAAGRAHGAWLLLLLALLLLLLVHCEACGRGLLCNGDVVVGGVTAGGDGGDGTMSKVVWGN